MYFASLRFDQGAFCIITHPPCPNISVPIIMVPLLFFLLSNVRMAKSHLIVFILMTTQFVLCYHTDLHREMCYIYI